MTDLVGELATRSEAFRGLWAAHNVRLRTKGIKRFNHPVVGELELSFDRFQVAADPEVMIVASPPNPAPDPRKPSTLLASLGRHPTTMPLLRTREGTAAARTTSGRTERHQGTAQRRLVERSLRLKSPRSNRRSRISVYILTP